MVIVNYNIQAWEATKKGNILLSLLVPKKYRVKKMDAYLVPFVEELIELWEGCRLLMSPNPILSGCLKSKAFLCGLCTIILG